MAEQRYSFPKERMKILLLEGPDRAAHELFEANGYRAEINKNALSSAELLEIIPSVHLLGIRSKTMISRTHLEAAKNLLGIGCFCIGTNQVDLGAAASIGVPVFNAPFSNTRSVAELVLAEIVMLSRHASERSAEMHQGKWTKSAAGCNEVRYKTIGIVGYGHIGPQVGILAESFGMEVVFFDIAPKLSIGKAQSAKSLNELLERSDYVTLHVPETPRTMKMIGKAELAKMKRGSYLLNLSRGTVVDIPALVVALQTGHLAGAAIDVFPEEPNSNEEPFVSELIGTKNVILTPHIGGSTFEAQRNIGIEVAQTLTRFTETGSTTGAVNFPQVELPIVQGSHRVLNIHRNVPGVLSQINSIVAEMGVNIEAQYLSTQGDVGYLIMDIDQSLSQGVKDRIDHLEPTIRTRLLF